MEIEYKDVFLSQKIDIDKLRPNKSYDYLIKNRNAALNDLISNPLKLRKFLKERNCPVCGQKENSLLFIKDNFKIVQCSGCEIVYVNPIFDEIKYKEIYKSEDYQNIVKKLGEESHAYRKIRFGKERIDFIEKFHDPSLPKTILEIGCSTGFVIEEGNERGWETIGVELNPSAAAFGRGRGLNIIEKPLEEIVFKRKFSAIAMYDVLEHLVNPQRFLEIANQLLYDGGNLFLYVPNYNSASKELLGVENAHFIWPTHHLTYFTPKTLKNFLERNGFNVFFWETQGLDLCDWLWFIEEKTMEDSKIIRKFNEVLQFYINASGHGKNLRMYARKVKAV